MWDTIRRKYFLGFSPVFGGLLAMVLAIAPGAYAADTIIAGAVGSASVAQWPMYIGIEKGFFAAEDLTIDVVFAQSSSAIIQQLVAGSVNVTFGAGLADPIRAIDKGAPIALVRVDMQSPPFALLAKSAIKSIPDLKGKTVSVGGASDITRLYFERMAAAHGLKSDDYDLIYAGATSARFSALQAGAVDATLINAPFNFYAEAAGFNNLGWTVDYVKDLPYSGDTVNRAWAQANRRKLEKFLLAYTRSILWFQEAKNRPEAIAIMVAISKLKAADVEKGYDFMRNGNIFEPTGTISRSKIGALLAAMRQMGELQGALDVERLVLPTIQLAD